MNEVGTCVVCSEAYSHEDGRIPRILIACGHSFCEGCLGKLETKRRKTEQYYRRKYSFLKSDYEYIKVVQNNDQYEIVCPKCKTKTTSDNPSSKLPKNYDYLDLMDEVLKDGRYQLDFCEVHPNYILDMFCHDDEEAVCLNCTTYGQHKAHKVSKLSWFADQQEASLRHKIDCLENVMYHHEELQSALKARKDYLKHKVDYIRNTITLRFSDIQSEIKSILDKKEESLLAQLDEYSASQMSLLKGLEELSLGTSENLEEIRDRANTFLAKADECDVATEKDLHSEINGCLDGAQSLEMSTNNIFEAQIDSSDHIVEKLKEMIDAWVCKVEKIEQPPTLETVAALWKKQMPCLGDSMSVMFGEKPASEVSVSIPFGEIDCKLLCDGELQHCETECDCDEDL